MTGLITLDELVENHPYLRDHWSSYKRMLKAAQLEPMKYGLDGSAMNEKLKKMEKLISPIEMKVIEGNMFEVSVSQSMISVKYLRYASSKFMKIQALMS